MTVDSAPSSEAEFHAELQSLVRRAHDEGIDVRGGWECRNDAEYPDWDVVISELQKLDSSE